MTEGEPRRYLAMIQFKPDTPLTDLAKRVPGLQHFILGMTTGEMEQVFRSPEGHIFGIFFKSKKPGGHRFEHFGFVKGDVNESRTELRWENGLKKNNKNAKEAA